MLAQHSRLLREAFDRYGGREIDTQGDSFFVVFPRARDATEAAVDVQRALAAHPWPAGCRVRVRIGMHTGEASLAEERYVGLAVHRAARISAAGHGGQILVSSSTRDVVEDDLPADQRLVDLGEQRLKDLPRPERVFQLVAAGLPADFPPLKTASEQHLAEAAEGVLATPWWRRGRIALPLAAAAGAAALVAVLLVLRGESDAVAAGVRANAVGLIDTEGGAIRAEVPVDTAPTSIAYGEGALWVTNANDGTVSRIDPLTRTVRQTITVGSSPSGIAVGGGAVWAANHLDGTVSRIDPATNTVVDPISVGNGPLAVAFGEGAVWVSNSSDRTLSRLDPGSGRVTQTIATDAVGRGVAVGGGSVWVTDESSRRVVRVDPQTNRVAETVPVGNGPTGIAFAEGAVWVANSVDGTVSRIDPERAAVTATLTVAGGPGAVAAGAGAVWVSVEFGQRLARIEPDAAEPRVVGYVAIGNRPKGVVATDDGVWVAVQESGRGHRGGRLIVPGQSRLPTIDPQLGAGGLEVSLVYDGLTGFRRTGGADGTQLVPNLAAAIPEARDGGRSYTFRLRAGIRYSDGRLVRPADFRRALERAFEVRAQFLEATGLEAVVGVDACSQGGRCDLPRGVLTTSDSVTFQLSRPAPLFLFDLTLLSPIPPGTPSRDVGANPVPSTGPYAIESYVAGRQLKLVRNPYFRVWSEAVRPDGYPDEIVFTVVNAIAEEVAAVVQGRADVTRDMVPAEQLDELRVRYRQQLHVDPQRWTHLLFLDTKQPPFTDIRVRRALNYAVDRRRLVELGGGPELRRPTCQVIPPTVPGYSPYCPYTLDPRPTGDWTAPDLAKARRLIAASGTRGEAVTVWTWPEFRKEAAYIVDLLDRLGYRARLNQISDIGAYFDTIFDPKTRPQSGILGWIGIQYGSAAIDTLQCEFFGNVAHFCDRAIDKEAARALNLFASDPEAAARIWARLDRRLVDQAPWVPLFTPRWPALVSKRVGNWQYHPYAGPLFDQLWVR